MNNSATGSVVASAVGVTVNEPVPLTLPVGTVIVTGPLLVTKSVVFDNAQFNIVPVVTLVVVTLNVNDAPSLTDVAPPAAATAYVGVANV